jgi:hypothetical protein
MSLHHWTEGTVRYVTWWARVLTSGGKNDAYRNCRIWTIEFLESFGNFLFSELFLIFVTDWNHYAELLSFIRVVVFFSILGFTQRLPIN